jgi:hypothetical protein
MVEREPGWISRAAQEPAWMRPDPDVVDGALARLGVTPTDRFVAFYRRYRGIFGSDTMGYALLDLCDSDPSVVEHTETCREVHGFPADVLVLSELLGGAVLAYRTTTDEVFDVDFEGGDELLRRGELAPRWLSFEAFLDDYFGRSSATGKLCVPGRGTCWTARQAEAGPKTAR